MVRTRELKFGVWAGLSARGRATRLHRGVTTQIGQTALVAERLKFSIYCRKSGRLISLYRINRTPTGLYLNDPHNPMKAMKQVGEVKRVGESGFTYHEDGNSWFKLGGDRSGLKRRETPLSDIHGARTLSTGVFVISDGGINPLEASVKLRGEDIVIDRPGPFGVEIILSDRSLALDPDPKRPNSELHTFDQVFPVILVEEFDLVEESGGVEILADRFPRAEPLVEGENLFFDHHGRI